MQGGLYRRVCLIKGWHWTQAAQDAWQARIRGSYGPRLAAMRQELDAIPAEAEGSALGRVQIEACMAEDIPFARWICADDFRDAPAAARCRPLPRARPRQWTGAARIWLRVWPRSIPTGGM